MASHNEWANRRIFDACSRVASTKLKEAEAGYDSVVGILEHLVQVEHSFLELALGRQPKKIRSDELEYLRAECAHVDRAYVDYVGALDPATAETQSFLVPWFGFEITLVEGVLQPMTHSHKHRADVSMLLPSLGGTGIEMDLIQWIAENR
ncbi:MAG: DinB family protein [Actinobacteria bacterium]|nr:DinB family protein [Actinomycetota bacterium]